MDTARTLLNGLAPQAFLDEYWQKKPLLIRQAIPNFEGLLTPEELAGLACEKAAESRIILQQNETWSVQQGPFDDKTFAELPEQDWTLLVQSVNHFLPEAEALLATFNFIPHARLDDLMVSYAPTGGSVGPHVDSYDVFLLQGAGRREWKVSAQTNHQFIQDAPIKVLSNFEAEETYVLEAGDMLYLPPHIAHWGTALDDDCMTYSIGFRAPNTKELIPAFFQFLEEQPVNVSQYVDPDLQQQSHPAEVSDAMVSQVSDTLQQLQWDNTIVAQFLTQYLSEPKAHTLFTPNDTMTLQVFEQRLCTEPLHLSLNSQLLFWQNRFYLNGEFVDASPATTTALQTLADNRMVSADTNTANALATQLHAYYLAGYCEFRD